MPRSMWTRFRDSDGENPRVWKGSRALVVGALATAVLLSACASGQNPQVYRTRELLDEVREAGFEPEELTLPFQLTDEMREWVRREVPQTARPQRRLEALLGGMINKKQGMGVRYEAGYTPTAAEVFTSQKANCLAFTHAFVGLAREVGLDAHYLDVLHVQRYERDKDEDLIVESGHVTAGYGVPTNRVILEYNVGPDADYNYVRQLSDLEALALYYSNRGAEILSDGDVEESLRFLRTAVTLEPDLADSWVNYGVALRRKGEMASAEEAYRKALELEPETLSAYQNLAALLQRQGRRQEATELLRASEALGNRNPYNFIHLGDIELRRGRFDKAERFYRKALKLYTSAPEPYAALGLLAFEMDRQDEARRWLRKAQKRGTDNARVRLLARRLDPSLQDDREIARIVPARS